MKLDSKNTAFITLDYQNGILGFVPGADAAVPMAAKAIQFARKNRFLIIHAGLGFLEGYPEVPDFETPFSRVRQNNVFVKGTPSAEFHKDLFKAGDIVVYKQRVSAFSDNQLEMILRCQRVEHLVLFGIATSGIVLSTLRQAFDKDFRSVVLKDASFDPDAEVHRILTEKVFPRQAWVAATDEFISAQGVE
ncbi:MAG TPA: cysteine hydrolase [Candidatus Sulfotelmatobacter sp.]|nr:cysteine hydrolase [Candidatus Sulfotelmatobacter sp.]